MKPNNFLFSLSLIGIAALIMALQNSHQLDTLTETVNQIQQNLANRRVGLAGMNNATQLADLLRIVNLSGLNRDYLKFLVDFLHLNMYSLPTEEELQQLIDVIREIQAKNPGSTPPSNFGNLFPKAGGAGGGTAV